MIPPGTNFLEADLSGANLTGAILSGANLGGADLSETELLHANLTGADLTGADLSEAHMFKADLSRTLLAETDFHNVTLSRSTAIDPPGERIHQYFAEEEKSHGENAKEEKSHGEEKYDMIARANHQLREAYSGNGLISRARNARFRERQARREEARAEGGRGMVVYAGSWLSQVITGYGVQLRWVVGSMVVLYLASALAYWNWGDMSGGESLYYSVVTFTTAPPEPHPTGTITRTIAGIETLAGTVAIVFLGYVLGTRERV